MLALAAASLVIEALLGYPTFLLRGIGHPVMWIGSLIGALDRLLNRPTLSEGRRQLNGVLAMTLVVSVPIMLAALFQVGLLLLPALPAWILLAAACSTLFAQRSLHAHVASVATALRAGGIVAGRSAVSHIVGRDPESLDEAGIVRAAIESLAENFSDGVTAPLLWCVLLGVPGIVAYKAINTADSMIGHLTPRYRSFGWAAARLDDLVNLPASRLAAFWLVLAAATRRRTDGRAAWAVLRRDGRLHRSPNAGWPEAAMAGGLGIRLAGPRSYGGVQTEGAWLGNGERVATIADLQAALSLYRRACAIQLAGLLMLLLFIAGLFWRW